MLDESGAESLSRPSESSHDIISDLNSTRLPTISTKSFACSVRLGSMEPDDETEEHGNHETDDYLLVDQDIRLQPSVPQIFHIPKLKGHDMFEITVDELQNFYSTEAFTSEEYVQFCLDRIQAVNPYLEAVIETNPDAARLARGLDDERAHSKARGPLHGVPVLVKDVGETHFAVTSSLSASCEANT